MPRNNYSTIGELDKVLHWIDHLRKASKKFTIVTQHKRDRDIMKALKCKNVCYPLEPFEDFVDMIASYEKPAILLYDIDRNSNKKCEKLKSALQQHGVKVNVGFRKLLFVEQTNISSLIKKVHRLAGSERVHKGLSL